MKTKKIKKNQNFYYHNNKKLNNIFDKEDILIKTKS